MSQRNPSNGHGGPPDDRGPPEGRGPPDHVRERQKRASRDADSGEIRVGSDGIEELREQVDFDSLSPFQAWLLAVLIEEGIL